MHILLLLMLEPGSNASRTIVLDRDTPKQCSVSPAILMSEIGHFTVFLSTSPKIVTLWLFPVSLLTS